MLQILFFFISLWGRWEKNEKVKLICFSDEAVKKHFGPSSISIASPLSEYFWEENESRMLKTACTFTSSFENWKLRLIIMAHTVQLCCWSNQLTSGEELNKCAQWFGHRVNFSLAQHIWSMLISCMPSKKKEMLAAKSFWTFPSHFCTHIPKEETFNLQRIFFFFLVWAHPLKIKQT